ncbi:MAG TPA: phosphate--AMP phosphotransferase, partial [Vicinamibacteria bacterium]|nr:phosphate--AMP phosphotransferase [Vicinamibacteria bacterium]
MLETVDLDAALSKDEYRRVFPPLEERLRRLQYALLEAEVPTVVAFEGWDAAGKGTVIQRLTRKLDPRACQAWPGSPPS